MRFRLQHVSAAAAIALLLALGALLGPALWGGAGAQEPEL